MRTMKTKAAALAAICAALLMASGCDHTVRLDARTFELKHLSATEAQEIVRPYVYTDRKDGPHGMMSASSDVLTVRETPDNLDKIQRVLQQYDVPRSDMRLHFQLIEADHFNDTDPAIAPVEAQLRKVFQFKGYRLMGETVVGATDGSRLMQQLARGYAVTTDIHWSDPTTIQLRDLKLYPPGGGLVLQTTVNIHPGQTVIVGSGAEKSSTATLLLTLRAEKTSEGSPRQGK